MDATTLRRWAPNLTRSRAEFLTPGLNMAMRMADCTTVQRCAMFLAMTRQESIGYEHTQEIGSDAYLRGKPYWPYIGRTFIQTTWDYNYRSLGKWLHARGLVDDPELFVKHPQQLADDRWAWYGPARFWMQDHPRDGYQNLNEASDAGDVLAATHMINGGEHGLSVRRRYYRDALELGTAILPDPPAPEGLTMDDDVSDAFAAINRRLDKITAKVDNTHTQLSNLKVNQLNPIKTLVGRLAAKAKSGGVK